MNVINSTFVVGFNFSIQDASGLPILADNISKILVQLVSTKNRTQTTARMAEPPALLSSGPRVISVKGGLTEISLGFLGTTLDMNNEHIPVQIEFSCAETSTQTCGFLTPIRTEPFIIEGVVVTPELTETYVTKRPVMRVPTFLPNLTVFNVDDFTTRMATFLMSNGVTYLNPQNAKSVLRVMPCEVDRLQFGMADLRDTVCGPSNICSNVGNVSDKRCPQGVIRCACPSLNKYNTKRHLLQEPDGAEAAATLKRDINVQVEVSIWLENAVAFHGPSIDVVSAEFDRLATLLLDGLTKSSQFVQPFKIQTDLVTTTTSSSVIVRPPPTIASTPASTVTEAPTETPMMIASAVRTFGSRSSSWWLVLLMIVFLAA